MCAAWHAQVTKADVVHANLVNPLFDRLQQAVDILVGLFLSTILTPASLSSASAHWQSKDSLIASMLCTRNLTSHMSLHLSRGAAGLLSAAANHLLNTHDVWPDLTNTILAALASSHQPLPQPAQCKSSTPLPFCSGQAAVCHVCYATCGLPFLTPGVQPTIRAHP